jgi:hypothetical protein
MGGRPPHSSDGSVVYDPEFENTTMELRFVIGDDRKPIGALI